LGHLGKYNSLLRKLDEEMIDIYDYDFDIDERSYGMRGLAYNGTILISNTIETNAERYCVALEEYWHIKLTEGDITDLSNMNNCKQEHKARMIAYETASEIEDMVMAYKSGARNIYELSEYLGLTEQFLIEASLSMQSKHGTCFKIKGYTVCFSPFEIYKNIEL